MPVDRGSRAESNASRFSDTSRDLYCYIGEGTVTAGCVNSCSFDFEDPNGGITGREGATPTCVPPETCTKHEEEP
jgi:hypothetical protein